jgi:5-methylthioadenosine/S-adenosylhomocysteine deaminase
MTYIMARWVLPIDRAPIENGEVETSGGVIAYCGPRRTEADRTTDGAMIDLGDAAVLPGLINVHTHIEYTALRGFIEDIEFFLWIRALIETKAQLSPDDWLASSRLGALECIRAGITTIGDNTDAGFTARICSEYGLRARAYQETFGIDHRQPVDERLADLDAKLQQAASYTSDRVEIGVSPHAPYTIRPELFRALGSYCEANRLRTSIHLAESQAESELILNGSGPIADILTQREIAWRTPGVTPTKYLYDLGALTQDTLCVHCVHQSPSDIDLIAASGASIAHCPKSNAKLGAGIAPLASWLAHANIAVGIGTDSAVSNNALDLFEEMRFALLLQRAHSESVIIGAEQILSAATLGGAKALGWDDRTGALRTGLRADIIAVRLDSLHAAPVSDPYAALVYAARADDVCLTMVEGRILYQDGEFLIADADAVRNQASDVRRKLVDLRPTSM